MSKESLVEFVDVKDEDIKPNPELEREIKEWENLSKKCNSLLAKD